ncbi:hypothetical protein KY348_03905, partial [Candidatus Woesearchaeota archaeon]|nr:hypothetical protein [Candidatus Woesearchaeota archaeon]
MLNYKNDSLLLNKETANDLIRNKNSHLIFLDEEKKILNLFSAFVKKDDFIKKDKICQPLQKTVYVKISQKLLNIIKNRFKDGKEVIKLLERYTNRRIVTKEGVNRWFNTRVVPLILLRLISKDKKELAEFIEETEYITDFVNKSKFYCPKTLDDLLNPQLIYLAGCSVGDGHIDKKGKRWVLVDGSSKKERLLQSHEFVVKLSNLLRDLGIRPNIRLKRTKCILTANNKPFCRFLNFFFGLPYGKKKEAILRKPSMLNLSKKDLEKYFWMGCFDTDGSVNKDGVIDFCSSDKNLLKECQTYLKYNEIRTKETEKVLTINIQNLKKFIYIGFAHPRKQKEYLKILKRGLKQKKMKIRDDKKIDKNLLKIQDLVRIDNNYRIRIHRRNLRKS